MADRICSNCGRSVSPSYWRAFSIDGVLKECVHCKTAPEYV